MIKVGENGDFCEAIIESWNEQVRQFIRGWKLEDVWNMDEIGSFWRGLFEFSLIERGKRCSGGK